MKTIQQPTTVVAILPLLLVLTATRAVNNATVLPGDNTAQVIHRYLEPIPKMADRHIA